ncbi:MAG: hypothetical protein WDM71_06495, partial [Ferruginibacter sp.]
MYRYMVMIKDKGNITLTGTLVPAAFLLVTLKMCRAKIDLKKNKAEGKNKVVSNFPPLRRSRVKIFICIVLLKTR